MNGHDDISQAERRRILREGSTYHAHANDVELEMGGRFAKLHPTQVTGSTPAVAYPRLPEGNPSNQAMLVGDEPPIDRTEDGVKLGYRIDGQTDDVERKPRWRRI